MTQYVLSAMSWMDFGGILNFFRDLKRRNEIHRNIRHTIKELSALTDKELNDIGLSRGDIWSVAHEAYFDNRTESNQNLRGWV